MQKEYFDKHDLLVADPVVISQQLPRLYTRSVHIIIFNEKNQLLLCQRAAIKQVYPNLFTSSAGGRVEYKETYEQAAYRELQEELGISVPLFDFGYFSATNKYERSHHHLFVGAIPNNLLLTFDSSEISHHRWIKKEAIALLLQSTPEKFALPFIKAFAQLVKLPHYIIDFDHTLFDWYGFKKEFQAKLEKIYHIKESQFVQAKTNQEKKDGLYNIFQHLKYLSHSTTTPFETLKRECYSLTSHGERFLFPDAKKFLNELFRKPVRVTLLTYGDKRNQKFFIEATKIENRMNKIVYVTNSELKSAYVEKVISQKNSGVFLINDNPHEAAAYANTLSTSTQNIVIERPTAKYTTIKPDKRFTIITTLTDVPIF